MSDSERGMTCVGALQGMTQCRTLGMKVNKRFYKGNIAPTVQYCEET